MADAALPNQNPATRYTASCYGPVIGAIALAFGLGLLFSVYHPGAANPGIADIIGWVFATIAVLIVAGLGAIVVVKMACNTIDLSKLLAEANGDASLSRFQMLLFTFVIASLYVIYALSKKDGLPAIDPSVLGLLGISGGSYVLSKGIQKTAETSQANTAAVQAAQVQVAQAAAAKG